MGRTVSLKGAAAAAFMNAAMGKPADTEEEQIARVLTHIEMCVKDGTKGARRSASSLLLIVARGGLALACESITAAKAGG